MQKGTILTWKIGNESNVKILEVLGDLYFVSQNNYFDDFRCIYTKKELEERFILPKSEFKPKTDDMYWFVDTSGGIIQTLNNASRDKARISVGNCFETEALAQEALERVLKAYRE